MNKTHRITFRHTVKHLVRVDMGGNVVTIIQQSRPRINVVSVGVQGPVGTVAESVLTMAEEAKVAAEQAMKLAEATSQEQADMVSGMILALDHYIGAIGA